ncbi:MAG: oligosaccharide flippase family protein [Myxococcota bacterium]|nr:oligosaccharide flippase family protein [Myxococcota bacterium]
MGRGRALGATLRDLSLKGLSLGLERGCRLAVIVASARVLGDVAFGRFVFASTVTSLLALGTDLGLGIWTTRALAREPTDGASVVRVGLTVRSLASLPYALAIAAVAAFAVTGESRMAMVLLGVSSLANAFADHLGAILRGSERFADEARMNASRAVLTMVIGTVALSFGRSLASLCAGLAAASIGALVYGASILFRGRRAGALAGPIALSLARSALRESLPLWFAGLVSLLYFKIDTLFVRAIAGEAELGAYGAAYKFFEGAMIVPAVLLAVTFPRLARVYRDASSQRWLERRVTALLLGLGVLAGAACLFGRDILVVGVFGPGYGRARDSLRVLALGLPLLFVNYGWTHFLVARDMGRATLWLASMMLALTVALDVLFIPRLGGPGAAWATVLAEVALTASCWAALRKRKGAAQTPPKVLGAPRTDRTAA